MPTSYPEQRLLVSALPLQVWQAAERQAERCPLLRFRTGAVIWHPERGIIATGAAHQSDATWSSAISLHAEHHALRRGQQVAGAEIAIVTLSGCGNWASSSCPCYSCARLLASREIALVHYPLWQHGKWQVISESPKRLLSRAAAPRGRAAKDQRIPLA